MKRIISALALLAVVGVGIAGCGGDDDDDDTTNNGGTGGTTVIPSGGEPSANGGEPAASGGQPATGNVECDATQQGVCQNEMDCPFVADGTARLTAGSCGQGCIGKAETCSRDCILMMLDMSSECASCYADTVNCTIMNCLSECIGAAETDACKMCQVDKGCREEFDQCSGLPPG
jgi:hypothetical protein